MPEVTQESAPRYEDAGTVVTYRCSNRSCQAEDHDKLFSNEHPRPVVNCWRCGAGRGLPIEEMLMKRIGMFPVPPEQLAVDEAI